MPPTAHLTCASGSLRQMKLGTRPHGIWWFWHRKSKADRLMNCGFNALLNRLVGNPNSLKADEPTTDHSV